MAKSGLHISKELTLPPSSVTATTVIYGGKGMGKTNFGAVLVEELSANRLRWSVIDPMGVWWGMRYSSDGRGKGVECLILGGAHGDIPIEPTGGAVIADLVADESVNVIIDISRKADGAMWSIADRIRFMTDYGRQLYARQGSLINGRRREPLCQVIDEAARFIPQMIRSGQPQLAECTGVWSAIVEEGRNVGIGVVLMTQRSARLNKDVAELADMMMAFRTVGPNSIEAVLDWLGEHVPKQDIKSMVEKLRSLPVGSCLAVSPGWLQVEKVVAIRHRHTFDSSATPKPGEAAKRVHGNGAKPDLAVYADRMRDTIERAKENNVSELKKQIRELQAQVAKGSKQLPAPIAAKTIIDPALKKENADLRAQLVDRQKKAQKLEHFLVQQIKPTVDRLLTQAAELLGSATPSSFVPAAYIVPPPPSPLPATPRAPVPASQSVGTPKIGGVAAKIASVVAGYGARGQFISRQLLATLCGATVGGSFSARLSEARTAGLIRIEGKMVHATPEGIRDYAGAFHVPETTAEVAELWRPRLGGVSRQIFDHLLQLGGESISRSDLATAVGASIGGSFSARLSEVRSTGLLVENGSTVALNRELLFL